MGPEHRIVIVHGLLHQLLICNRPTFVLTDAVCDSEFRKIRQTFREIGIDGNLRLPFFYLFQKAVVGLRMRDGIRRQQPFVALATAIVDAKLLLTLI